MAVSEEASALLLPAAALRLDCQRSLTLKENVFNAEYSKDDIKECDEGKRKNVKGTKIGNW